ncbi:uncharacterized protein Elp5 [Eurosta solidaginis]|uniref:uncharacterized protein Elp5 n=1 Tax=Eurosta solidaginis TaxID=178769 RepID=UPI0035307E0E
MLSNLIITSQRVVLIIDETGQEKISNRILCQLLREQGYDEKLTVKTLPFSPALRNWSTLADFGRKCINSKDKCNVILPPLADLLCHQSLENIIQFIHKLRLCEQVDRVFIWLTPANVMHPRKEYLLAAFEYLADIMLHLETPNTLSVLTRKSGGSVSRKRYLYTKTKNEFLIDAQQNALQRPQARASSPIANTVAATFKIELNEEEIVARNTLKLPYEKTSEAKESSIIYTPDAADDFDEEEEDPDDDLCI